MGPFLVIIGLGMLYVVLNNKADPVLAALMDPNATSTDPWTVFWDKVGEQFKSWMFNNIWGPIALATGNAGGLVGLLSFLQKPALPGQGGQTSSTSGQGNNALVHGFNIPLAGGGSMTVNSTTLQGAIDNVIAQGGTPA
jgi:hypothetical protein